MLGCHIPSYHIFLAINIQTSEVEHLHKFEQALPYQWLCSQHYMSWWNKMNTLLFQVEQTCQGICDVRRPIPLLKLLLLQTP